MTDDIEPVAYEGVNTNMLTHAKWGHPKSRVDVPDEVVGEWDPLVRAQDVRERIDEIRYECEDLDALDMLHKLKDELEDDSLNSGGSAE